jgi:hypothetical protein
METAMNAHLSYPRAWHLLLPALLLLPLSTVAADPPTGRLNDRVSGVPRPDVPMTRLACAHPFENRGTYRMDAGFSGAGASSDFIPAGKFLEIRSVKATLHGSALSAGNLGLAAGGAFAWYDLRVDKGAVVYSASRDGALYADGDTRIKFVAYRNGGYDQALDGDYAMSGCLVDAVPPRLTRPDVRAPRLPKKRLTPLEPVEAGKLVPIRSGR